MEGVIPLNERLKLIRESKGMNQSDFAKLLGMGQSTLAMMEVGKRDILDRHIKTICSICGVSEEWFRTGKGEMLEQDDDATASQLAHEFSLDKLGQSIIKSYLHLSDFEKAVIGNYVKSVAKEYEKVEDSQSNEAKSEPNRGTDEIDPDIKQELDSYRQELEMEKSIRTSSVSPHSGENVS
jgi:transcriptional regulator with XRE-family HTH domain